MQLKLIAGSGHPRLARAVAKHLRVRLTKRTLGHFPNSETSVTISANLTGADVFIVQPLTEPTNDNLMQLLLLADAARRLGAKRITAVIPYFGYARQDREFAGEPVSLAVVAGALHTATVDRVVVLDPHSGGVREQLEAVGIAYHRVWALPLFVEFLSHKKGVVFQVVSPDFGGGPRAQKYASELTPGEPPIVLAKERRSHTEVTIAAPAGRVQSVCVLIDDILASGSTLVKAAEILKKRGAKQIWAAVTHGEFTGDAKRKLERSGIEKIYVTNSLAVSRRRHPKQVIELDISRLLAEAIRDLHEK